MDFLLLQQSDTYGGQPQIFYFYFSQGSPIFTLSLWLVAGSCASIWSWASDLNAKPWTTGETSCSGLGSCRDTLKVSKCMSCWLGAKLSSYDEDQVQLYCYQPIPSVSPNCNMTSYCSGSSMDTKVQYYSCICI